MTALQEFAFTALAILGTLVAVVGLIGLCQWIANLRSEAADHRRQAAERDRMLALEASERREFALWRLHRYAPAPVSRVIVANATDRDTPEPYSMRPSQIAADEALLSDPVNGPVTVRSEDLA